MHKPSQLVPTEIAATVIRNDTTTQNPSVKSVSTTHVMRFEIHCTGAQWAPYSLKNGRRSAKAFTNPSPTNIETEFVLLLRSFMHLTHSRKEAL